MNETLKRTRMNSGVPSRFSVLCGQVLFFFCSGIVLPTSSLPGIHMLWDNLSDDLTNEPMLGQRELNLTSFVGRTISLPCRVKNLEDKTVSWIRGKDLTVLAVDTITYTSDQRFQVLHDLDSEEWWLQLRGVKKTDEGPYDCQINTYPKISTKVYLKVFSNENEKAKSSILDRPISDTGVTSSVGSGIWRELSQDSQSLETGQKNQFGVILKILSKPRILLEVGKTLHLTCEAVQGVSNLNLLMDGHSNEQIIRWELDDVPIEILFPEWKVDVKEFWTGTRIHSELRLNSVTHGDAGRISCIAPQTDRVSVNFEIKEEKSPKQLYLGLSSSSSSKHQHHHYTYPVSSAVSGAVVKTANDRFVVMCTTLLFIFMLTHVVVRYLHARKT